MGRSYLAHSSGDANNAVLAAVSFRVLLNWLRLLWLQIWITLLAPIHPDQGTVAG